MYQALFNANRRTGRTGIHSVNDLQLKGTLHGLIIIQARRGKSRSVAVRDLLAGRPVKLQASVRWRFKLGPPISLVLLVQNMHAGSAAFLRITIVDPLSLNSWVSLEWPTIFIPFFCNI